MKIYTFYTDSHKELLDIFKKNYHENTSTEHELNIKHFPQECNSGNFMEQGWNSTMKRKVEYVIEGLNNTPDNQWFVHTDCDIILFKDWVNILKKHEHNFDMLIQDDYSSLCAGFFFCKSNSVTKKLWQNVFENLHKFNNDQIAMNYFISKDSDIKVAALPNTYFTYGLLGKDNWTEGDFEIPSNIKMFHANWTVGVKNKKHLMEYVNKKTNL